nr:hypothetical protein [Nocardioidaceae bacterium]
MPDTPELTPPPDEPLLDATRAEIRQRLSAATQTEEQRPGNRWLVPGLAAAAVLTVVAGAFAVASTNDDGAGGEGSSLQPAGSETTQPSTTVPGELATTEPKPSGSAIPTSGAVPATTPTVVSPPQKTVAPTTVTAVVPPQVSHATSCADEVSDFAKVQEPALQGATVTAERDSAAGTTYLYETKSAWVVCDDSTAVLG